MIDAGTYTVLLPEILTGAGGLLLTLLAPWGRASDRRRQNLCTAIAVLVLSGALLALFFTGWNSEIQRQGPSMFAADGFSRLFRALFLLVALLTVLSSRTFLLAEGLRSAEFHALILFSYLGMALMAGSRDLLLTFLGLEIVSVGSYILLGLRRSDLRSHEAAWKYFLLGSASSAIFLYGIAMIYGAVGSTAYQEVYSHLVLSFHSPLSLMNGGLTLFFIGLAFKLALVPFHAWTADVYEGSPTLIAGFLSTGPKAAAMAALLRFFFLYTIPQFHWNHFLVWIAVMSMVLGNLAAFPQRNLKRMLAYSSIAHGGYMLLAFFLDQATALSCLFLYLTAYVLMNLGAFLVLSQLSGPGDYGTSLSDLSGLSERHPLLTAVFSLFLLSLIGFPLTGGFTAKLYLFGSIVKQGMIGLVILAVLNSAASAYYYLRPLVYLYMRPATEGRERTDVRLSVETVVAIGIAAIGTVWLGIAPSLWLKVAERISLTFP